MIGKRIVPREQANRDVDEALEYYLKEASDEVALGFIDALEKAYTHIKPASCERLDGLLGGIEPAGATPLAYRNAM